MAPSHSGGILLTSELQFADLQDLPELLRFDLGTTLGQAISKLSTGTVPQNFQVLVSCSPQVGNWQVGSELQFADLQDLPELLRFDLGLRAGFLFL